MTISMTAVCCSVLQCVAACCIEQLDDNFKPFYSAAIPQHTATHCSTLKHAATHCNTLQHTPTHSNTLQRTSSWMTISTTVLFRPLSVTHQPLHMYVETHTQTHTQSSPFILTNGTFWFFSFFVPSILDRAGFASGSCNFCDRV